jgi:hypothetical protein
VLIKHRGFEPAIDLSAFVAPTAVREKCGFQFTGFESQLNRNRYQIEREEWVEAASSA